MKNYYDSNYQLFLKRNPLYEYMEKEESEACEVVIETDRKGNELWAIIKDDYKWYLGSTYDNEHFKQVWLDNTELKNYEAIVYLFGFGDIDLVRKVIKKYPKNRVIIYEPSLSYMKWIMENYDLQDMILNSKVVLLSGKEGLKHLLKLSVGIIEYTNYTHSIYRAFVQYPTLYKDVYDEWSAALNYSLTSVVLDKNTNIKYGEGNLKNVIANHYDCIKSSNIVELANELRDKMNDTAILVSAGPSLDKNVELLKEAKGKVMILAVDTAIRPLLKRGIIPDLTITIDSYKPTELFMYNDEFVDIPMITCISGNVDVIRGYKGRRIYEYDMDPSFALLYNKSDYLSVSLGTAGSVANNGFSFLLKVGFKNVILIGQDLAYPNGKIHAESTFKSRDRIDYVKEDSHFEVEDIYGGKVYTEHNMNQYREWFEKIIAEYPQFNVIDATEGGAKINGTTIMTLREAIDKYVLDQKPIDYEKIIVEMPTLSEGEIERRLDIFYDFPNKLRRTKEDIKEAMNVYDRLETLNERGDYSSQEFKKIVKEVDRLSEKIKNSVFASYMARIKEQMEYDILNEIYVNKDSVYDDFKLIVDSGKRLLTKYLNSYDMVEKMVVDAVEYAKAQEVVRKQN